MGRLPVSQGYAVQHPAGPARTLLIARNMPYPGVKFSFCPRSHTELGQKCLRGKRNTSPISVVFAQLGQLDLKGAPNKLAERLSSTSNWPLDVVARFILVLDASARRELLQREVPFGLSADLAYLVVFVA